MSNLKEELNGQMVRKPMTKVMIDVAGALRPWNKIYGS